MSADRYSFVCNRGCGVCRLKLVPFEYERTETLEGELLGSKCRPQVVSSCCGGDVHVYDNQADEWGNLVDVIEPADAPEAGQEAAAVQAVGAWINVNERLPECDHETIFIGVNTAGFAGAFNSLRKLGRGPTLYCLYGTADEEHSVMSDLEWWQPLPAPPAALSGSLGDGLTFPTP